MCTKVTDIRPVRFPAGQPTIKVLDYDNRRVSLILNVVPGDLVQEVTLDLAIAGRTEPFTIAGTDTHSGSAITGTVDPVTGATTATIAASTSTFDGAGTLTLH